MVLFCLYIVRFGKNVCIYELITLWLAYESNYCRYIYNIYTTSYLSNNNIWYNFFPDHKMKQCLITTNFYWTNIIMIIK